MPTTTTATTHAQQHTQNNITYLAVNGELGNVPCTQLFRFGHLDANNNNNNNGYNNNTNKSNIINNNNNQQQPQQQHHHHHHFRIVQISYTPFLGSKIILARAPVAHPQPTDFDP